MAADFVAVFVELYADTAATAAATFDVNVKVVISEAAITKSIKNRAHAGRGATTDILLAFDLAVT